MADPESPDQDRDSIFSPSERLFRRVPREDVVEGSVSSASLPSPAFSVNREKYCSAAEALAAWKGFSVAAFPVEGIPQVLVSEDGREYQFGVEHEPIPSNYSHSEVNTYAEGRKLQKPQQPPRLLKKKFRDLLRKSIQILEDETA
jgi:hypothetical protein